MLDEDFTYDGLFGRPDRETMLTQLGFHRTEGKQNCNETSSKLSRVAVVQSLETLDSLRDHTVIFCDSPSVSSDLSAWTNWYNENDSIPTIIIMGFLVNHYAKWVADRVEQFRRDVLNASDACF